MLHSGRWLIIMVEIQVLKGRVHMIGFLNAGSLLLGLIAWSMPVIGIIRRNKMAAKNRLLFSVISLSACAFSVWMQIVEINQRVLLHDWTALMDTGASLVTLSLILVTVTIILNAIVWLLSTKQPSS